MNTRELIETAQLDALGLLDDAERDAFDSAFFAASPDLQAQIRREQSRLVRADWLPLTDVEPPAELKDAVMADITVAALRGKVLGAVHSEIVRSSARTNEPAAGSSAHHGAGRIAPGLRSSRRVTPLWRAAALGFASAAIAFGGALLHLRQKYEDIDQGYRAEMNLGQIAQVKGLQIIDVLLNGNSKKVELVPQSKEVIGRAALHFDAERDTATVYYMNLNPVQGALYRIVAIDDEGKELQELARFEPEGGLKSQQIAFNKATMPRVAIMLTSKDPSAGPGTMILATDPVLG